MIGYIDYINYFLNKDNDEIVERLKKYYPNAEQSQINSWYELIRVIKSSTSFKKLNPSLIIGIEYSLPVDSMGVDFFVCGQNSKGNDFLFLLESKQWGDDFISKCKFSQFRDPNIELYPQVQVYKHKLAISNYLEYGAKLTNITPYVFIENASLNGVEKLKFKGDPFISSIPVINDLDIFFNEINKLNLTRGNISITEFYDAKYFPSKSIINAMESIITKEEPFLLTKSQELKIHQIMDSVNKGKKVIHISGKAGSGKTTLLLNLYVKLLKKRDSTGYMPYFASGGQNTWLYRSLYPEISNLFSWTFSMQKLTQSNRNNKNIFLIDEAQTNKNGLLLNLVNSGAIVIFCYDENQIVNLNNSVEELPLLQKRDDYEHITLTESVRFNGSQDFDDNIRKFLNGESFSTNDPNYMFKITNNMSDLKKEINAIVKNNPNDTLAISGLLCNSSQQIVEESNGLFFTRWGNKEETQWMPYVLRKNYLNEFNGSFWLGTWWLPGLDVDYNVVIMGSDVRITDKGMIGIPEESKLFQMIQSILDHIAVPNNDKLKGCTSNFKYFKSYCLNNPKYMQQFMMIFNKLIRNYYYIMLTRGRKGCIIYYKK